ncbi:aldehyde dehydrogenase family protein [Pseudarthrobacter phenanthrenivorans]|uniref:aldehyde dehydrogenase family protein n=1 Tax=Pseudarthrobacter phenanthrenivorans TaxID=361575 RepID=UPI00344C0682
MVSKVSGLGISLVRESTSHITTSCADAYDQAQFARPAGTIADLDDPRAAEGVAAWVRRGSVLGVHAAGNHPSLHASWIEALALGYRVAVRPSRREPFTPYRLISALRAAGFGTDQVVLLPTDHDAADEMMRGCDRSMVYGGEDVIRKYENRPNILAQGPGRSKMLITAGGDWENHLDLITDSVSKNAGVSCTNTTAIFVEGDARALAHALAQRLEALPTLSILNNDAGLPVQAAETARALEAYLRAAAEGTTPILGEAGIVEELGDGSAVLRPAVHLLPDPLSRQANIELPFPCVWIAPWTREAGIAPLKQTLALTVLTDDEQLVRDLLAEPTIRNVYSGPYPTFWNAPGVPHDGYLADFLMESKGFIRS